jgi:hypothetical protein
VSISLEELASRINAEAARRNISADELLDIVAAQLPDRSEATGRFAFAGQGRSGRGDLSERHKQIRQELIAVTRTRGA